jgi:hypothetical protein
MPAKSLAPPPTGRNRYVLDRVESLMRSSTAAVPGGTLADRAWGKYHLPDSPNAFHNMVSRLRADLARGENPLELVSTTYNRTRRPGER